MENILRGVPFAILKVTLFKNPLNEYFCLINEIRVFFYSFPAANTLEIMTKSWRNTFLQDKTKPCEEFAQKLYLVAYF